MRLPMTLFLLTALFFWLSCSQLESSDQKSDNNAEAGGRITVEYLKGKPCVTDQDISRLYATRLTENKASRTAALRKAGLEEVSLSSGELESMKTYGVESRRFKSKQEAVKKLNSIIRRSYKEFLEHESRFFYIEENKKVIINFRLKPGKNPADRSYMKAPEGLSGDELAAFVESAKNDPRAIILYEDLSLEELEYFADISIGGTFFIQQICPHCGADYMPATVGNAYEKEVVAKRENGDYVVVNLTENVTSREELNVKFCKKYDAPLCSKVGCRTKYFYIPEPKSEKNAKEIALSYDVGIVELSYDK